MCAATEGRTAKAQPAALLAGLECGMVGVLWMLLWLGVSSVWQQRSFWTPENLMATAFDRNATLAPVFTWATCAGLAVYLLIYSLLGAMFGALVHRRVPPGRVMLLGVIFALAWYYFAFHFIFLFALPLVALLHVERATLLGHLVYGTILGRHPVYVHRLMGTSPTPIEQPVTETVLTTEAVEEKQGPPAEP